jgi:P pilus assembly chaperone PapD
VSFIKPETPGIHVMKNDFFDKKNSMKSALKLFFFLLSIQSGFMVPAFLCLAVADTKGVGKGILVAPVKLEFEGRTRSGTFKVLNKDSEVVHYRIVFAPLIEKDKGKDAKDWVRFSPRRISLNPGQHQTIRVVVRKPLDLAPGEYTARILIQAIPPVREKSTEPAGKIQVNLDIVYGVSIPIIIKHNP